MNLNELKAILTILQDNDEYKELNKYVKGNSLICNDNINQTCRALGDKVGIKNLTIRELKSAYIKDESSIITDKLL